MILGKKQIQGIFLIKFKMDCKIAQTTCNINKAFGPGTGSESTVQWRFKKFCEGKKTLEDKYSGWPLEVDNDQLRGSSKLILLQLNEKFLKHSTLTIL